MTDNRTLTRFRFSGSDIDSFVIPFSQIKADMTERLCLEEKKSLSSVAPKIGVILALEKGYDGYVIDEPYVEALQEQGADIFFLTYEHIAEQIMHWQLDGILLIGGNFDSPQDYYLHPENLSPTHQLSKRSLAYLEAIKTAYRQQIPVLGICAGYQMLAGFFGAKMYVNVQEELKSSLSHKFDKRQIAHQVTIVPQTKLAEICGNHHEIAVNSIHSEGVAEPQGDVPFKVSARSEDGNIEAIEMKGDWFALGVQWHPEYLWHCLPEHKALFTAFVEAAQEYKRGKN